VTWQEVKELIPSLTDDEINLFNEVFGFLLVNYSPKTSASGDISVSG